MQFYRLYALLFIAYLLLSSSSCERNSPSGIPFVPVNLQLTVSNPEFVALQAVGGWVEIGGGSMGIIVYRFSPTEFRAYDRHCTFLVDEFCRVSVDNTQITAHDADCCDSKYILVDGAPVEGPANIALHQYNTSFDGNNLLIFN